MKTPDYQTTRIWKRTLRKVRLIAALTDERIVQVLDRLADQELQRVQHAASQHENDQNDQQEGEN